jgi:imidazolonepropionase-like amidohydrolase
MLAIRGGTVHTVSRGTLEGAAILLDGGKIVAVGHHLPIPADADILDAAGMVITPGLIDCHTHLGIAEEGVGDAHVDKNEIADPVCPHLRALDAVNPEDEGLEDAVGGGVTAIIATPGSENVIGGQSVAIKTRGRVIDDMVLRQPAGLKIAFGENPIKTYGDKNKAPSTRMTVAGIIRENLVAAQDYLRKPPAERNLRLETLARALRGEIPFRAHAHAADEDRKSVV